MKSNIELIRILFPNTQLVHKDETTEYYKYSAESFILEIDIAKEITEARIILKNEVVHTEQFASNHLLKQLPYLRGLAMGKVIDGSLDTKDIEVLE